MLALAPAVADAALVPDAALTVVAAVALDVADAAAVPVAAVAVAADTPDEASSAIRVSSNHPSGRAVS